MKNHTPFSSHALTSFVKGAALPYTMTDGVTVTAVTPREGVLYGSPVKRSNIHLIESLAGAWTDHGLVIGARWKCGAGSIGVNVFSEEWFLGRYGDVYKQPFEEYVCANCIAAQDGSNGPCVYRVWDKSGDRLLYIGSTKNWRARRAQHRQNTWWWPLAKSVDLERHSTLRAAREAEERAIRAERPRMNIAHNREKNTG